MRGGGGVACIYMEGWGSGDQKVTNMLGCCDLHLRIKTECPVSEPSSSDQVQCKIPTTLPNVVFYDQLAMKVVTGRTTIPKVQK